VRPSGRSCRRRDAIDAFLSYARVDEEFVLDYLFEALKAKQKRCGSTPISGRGTGWRERVKRGIEACNAFVFVVSPASLCFEQCVEELDDAVSLN
jgi:TIR domain